MIAAGEGRSVRESSTLSVGTEGKLGRTWDSSGVKRETSKRERSEEGEHGENGKELGYETGCGGQSSKSRARIRIFSRLLGSTASCQDLPFDAAFGARSAAAQHQCVVCRPAGSSLRARLCARVTILRRREAGASLVIFP